MNLELFAQPPTAILTIGKDNTETMNLKTVGIKDINYPVRLREKSGGLQKTVASINLHVNMPRNRRGSCVTTFLSVLNSYQDDISATILPDLLGEVKKRLNAATAHLEMTFPYFIEKKAPVSLTPSLMEYTCRFTCSIAENRDFILSVWVPVTTLCPCSKEISKHGAHNQRAEVNLNVKFKGFIWMEDLISLVESSASSEVFALLKRPDEKHVTEQAYNNPMFVEDVVRKVAGTALARPDITWFSVGVESFESIHKHNAYAFVDSDDM